MQLDDGVQRRELERHRLLPAENQIEGDGILSLRFDGEERRFPDLLCSQQDPLGLLHQIHPVPRHHLHGLLYLHKALLSESRAWEGTGRVQRFRDSAPHATPPASLSMAAFATADSKASASARRCCQVARLRLSSS